MPALTRRRYPDVPEECWHVNFGDVHVGVIAIRTGSPHDEDPWGWNCGFYPGSPSRGMHERHGRQLRKGPRRFWAGMEDLFLKRTEADFQEWRDQRDWTERKYAMWARGEKLPSQIFSSMMTCPCGVAFDSHDPEGSYVHRVHIYAKQAADGIRR
jgi:hypothetical protein